MCNKMLNEKKERRLIMFNKVVSIILVCLVSVSVAFGAVNYFSQKQIKADVDKLGEYYGEPEDVAREDDVKIAGEYEIKSTKQISDAYISGDTSALSDRDKETLDMAKAVLEEIIEDGASDYDKELAVYKYLTTEMKFDSGLLTVIPETDEDSDNPYGVLKNHTAVCVGYATTFRLLMQMMGIECMVVHNTDLTHSWDLVKLDGDWYHTDCYSDSETGSMINFNMNDSRCIVNHMWNRDFFPAANGTEYDPAAMNCETIEDIFAIPEFVSKKVEENESSLFSCTFKKEITHDDEKTAKYIVETVLNTLNNSSEDESYSNVWMTDKDGNYLLCISREHYEFYEDYDDIPEDVLEKANDAIAEYFPDYEMYGQEYDDYEGYYSYNGSTVTYTAKG